MHRRVLFFFLSWVVVAFASMGVGSVEPAEAEGLEIFFACGCARRSKKKVGGRCQGRATQQASDLPTATGRRILEEQASANREMEQEAAWS
ncbi:hypothetical protein [Pandoravirus japonicus]|uniref:Uncharacterized protein n=1 Tax=Pandoravirus japonicus TaxID=2823154 RepID=A0A811BMU8_9VIRU|nr:hypothetical protein [Pandoravirus japonicus]